VADYNQPESLEELFKHYGHQIAGVIFEPVVGNSGVIIPTPTFLTTLHQITKQYGALLIADEVMTGFRLAKGGATELLQLEPDLLCWGKIIGGGLPVGAYGGRAEIMEYVAPQGPVYQAGTLSGNPIAMSAGIATLRLLDENPPYAQLEEYGHQLDHGMKSIAQEVGIPVVINRLGSMITVFFKEGQVLSYADAIASNTEAFKQFFHSLLDSGIYWPPSQYEAAFFSTAHTSLDLDQTLEASRFAFASLRSL
jgi:glutamate-1-semialdehyde 2,1-aminomutase